MTANINFTAGRYVLLESFMRDRVQLRKIVKETAQSLTVINPAPKNEWDDARERLCRKHTAVATFATLEQAAAAAAANAVNAAADKHDERCRGSDKHRRDLVTAALAANADKPEGN